MALYLLIILILNLFEILKFQQNSIFINNPNHYTPQSPHSFLSGALSPRNTIYSPPGPFLKRYVIYNLFVTIFLYCRAFRTMSYQNSKKTVSGYSYYLNDRIGNGCSSEVFKGFQEKTKQLVSIKVVPKLEHRRTEQVEMAEAEIKALQALRGNCNLLELKHVVETKNSIYIITQLCERGTLREVLSRERKFEEGRAVRFLEQIIHGYRSIHAQQLVHRDIKPCNILLNLKEEVKIADFGFAISIEECQHPSKQNIGSPLYMPFESLAYNQYSYKSDLWAIGITFLEMLIGRTPWKSKTENELVIELEAFNVQKVLPAKLSERSSNFLRRILRKDVAERMSPEELFSYSFQERQNSQQIPTFSHTQPSSPCLEKPVDKKPQHQASQPSIKFSAESAAKNKCMQTSIGVVRQESEKSTQEHSRNNSRHVHQHQNHVSQHKKRASTFNSVIMPQSKNRETVKTTIGKSLIELKESNPNKDSNPNLLREPQLRRNQKTSKSSEVKQESPRLTADVQQQILLQIQSQMNYFRFLFKLEKRMNETLKTSDKYIKSLKENLLFMTHSKIDEIKILDALAFPSNIVEKFKKTSQYINMGEVLRQYNERYAKEEEKMGLTPSFKGEKDFCTLLAYSIKVLYQNLLKIEEQPEEMSRKKGLIFILEDLIHLSKLHKLQQQHNWKLFHETSHISLVLDKSPNEQDFCELWKEIKMTLKVHFSL